MLKLKRRLLMALFIAVMMCLAHRWDSADSGRLRATIHWRNWT
jgi:hypothetical protein